MASPFGVTITSARQTLRAGESTTITFTFTSRVKDFDATDLLLPQGCTISAPVASNPDSAGAANTWTATLTPNLNTQYTVGGKLGVNLSGITGYSALTTVTGEGMAYSTNDFIVDTLPPKLQDSEIRLNKTTLAAGESTTVTFNFSEAVTGFDLADVDVSPGATLSAPVSSQGGQNASSIWSATLTVAAATQPGSGIISVRMSGFADTAGNTGQGENATKDFTVSSGTAGRPELVPTTGISLNKSVLKVGETAIVTFTFSEAVTGFDATDVVLPAGLNFTLSAPQASNPTNGASTVWTATLTPPANTESSNLVLAVNLAGVTDTSGNTGVGTSPYSASFAVDTRAPTLAAGGITFSKSALKAGESTTVTFTFSEAVTGFDVNDVTRPTNFTLSAPVASSPTGANGASTVWTATLTPPANTQASTASISVNLAGVNDVAGNPGVGASPAATLNYDTQGPTMSTSVNSIAISRTTIKANETAIVTFTFSEAVTGFDLGDVQLPPGCSMSNPASSTPGAASTVWTATLTPNTDVQSSTGAITVQLAGVKDAAGNDGTGSSTSQTITIDTRAPTLVANNGISLDKSTVKAGETATVTFTFSEPVLGLDPADLVLSPDYRLSNPAPVGGTNGASTIWTATLTPTANTQTSSANITLRMTGVTDVAGNSGTGDSAPSASFTIDTRAPELLPNTGIALDKTTLKAGEHATVTFTFNEAVTGLGRDDLDLPTGWTLTDPVASNPTGSNGASTVWTATLTPPANSQSATGAISLRLNGVQDAAGNSGTGTQASQTITVDTSAPTLAANGIQLSRSIIKAGETATVTFTFSEPVTGLDANDVVLPPNFTLSAPQASNPTNGASTVWTATLTPPSNTQSASYTLAVNLTGVHDAAGNSGSGQSAASSSFTVDTSRPTLVGINFDKTVLLVGQTATVTFTFSEAVTGLDTTDVTLPTGCTLSAPVASNPTNGASTTWTATLTPPAHTQSTTGTVSVNLTGISDVAGNAGVGSGSASTSITFDTNAPSTMTTTIDIPKTTLKAGESTTVTFTFNEAMTGFDVGDLIAPTGFTFSPLAAVNPGTNGAATQWTTTLSGAQNTNSVSGNIAVRMSGLNDATGNPGVGTSTASQTVTVDTRAPTLDNISLDKSVIKANEQATVTFTFSEAVKGFDRTDLVIPAGAGYTLTDPAMVNPTDGASAVWRATLTPNADVQSTTTTISVHTTGLTDVAGNQGAGDSTPSASFTIDTRAPALVANNGVHIDKSTLKAGDTATVTFTFTEAVRGLDLADIDLPPGCRLTAPVASNASADGASTTWTATLSATDDAASTGNTITVRQTGVTDVAGNTGTGISPASASNSFAIDAQRPALISGDRAVVFEKTTIGVDQTSTVTFTFTEAVTGFDVGDVTGVPNGTLANMQAVDANGNPVGTGGSSASSVYWRATFTPTANVEDATNNLSINLAGVSDAAGNLGTGTGNSGNYAVDTVRPKLVTGASAIEFANTALKAGQTTTVTFRFTEAVSGFTAADVTMTEANGTLSNFEALDASGNRVETTNPSAAVWRATFTPTANVTDTTNQLSVNLTGVTDAAGNAGEGTTPSANYTVDTQRPTLTASVFEHPTIKAGQTSTVTFTFSEAVTGFDVGDVTGVPNGTLSNMVALNAGGTAIEGGSSASSTVWRATLTPTAEVEHATNTLTVNLAGVQDAAGNTGTSTAETVNYAVDTKRPTLTTANIAIADSALKADETTTVTFTFSEAVSGFTSAAVTVPNGTLGTMKAVDATGAELTGAAATTSTIWRATLTPTANVEDAANTLSVNLTGVQDAAGNAGSGTATSANYTVDTKRPGLTTANIAITDAALKAGESTAVTFTFDEAVTGFDTSDVTAPNGTLTGLVAVDADGNTLIGGASATSTKWRATFTPTGDVESATNVLTVKLTGVTDAAGNLGTGNAVSANYTIDTKRPTLTTANIVIADNALKAGETTTVTFTFSEAVSGFSAADVTTPNGTLGNMVAVDANGTELTGAAASSSVIWRTTLTPATNAEAASNTLSVNMAGVTDAAGNDGAGATLSANYAVDTKRPALTTANIVIADSALKASGTTTVTFTFSEAVSGFGIDDVTVPNGALSNMQAVDANGIALTGTAASSSAIWRATLTPTANVEDATNTLSVDLTRVQDAAGNTGTGTATSANYTVDTLRPTLTTANIVIADSALKAGETTTVTFTFSEAVTGFDISDVTVANGTLSNLVAVDANDAAITGGAAASSTKWRATLTPAENIEDATNTLSVNMTGVQDAAGNAGTGATPSANYEVDTVRPTLLAGTAGIAISDTALKAGDTATVTFHFSEAVSGFDVDDVTVPNGTLTGMQAVDERGNLLTGAAALSSANWRATLTPTGNLEDATNTLSVNLAGLSDTAGNTGSGPRASDNYAIDTLRPTLLAGAAGVTIGDSALKTGDSTTVTFHFSEAVSGFDVDDVTVPNGTLTGMQAVDAQGNLLTGAAALSSAHWRATLAPAAGVQDESNTLTVALTGVQDAAGNAGSGSAASTVNYTVDTIAPTISATTGLQVTMTPQSTAGQATTYRLTATFSEAVTGLTIDSFTVPDGTLSNLVSSEGGLTWTATLTPSANVERGEKQVVLNLTGVTDIAGNHLAATSVTSNRYEVDTRAPVIASATANGNRVVLRYTDGSNLDAVNKPDASAFSVRADNVVNNVIGVAVDAAAKTVTLSLANSVLAGQAVSVSYTDAAGDSVNAVQDAHGNDAASLASYTASNATPSPASPPAPASPSGGGGVDVDPDTDDDGVSNGVENSVPGLPRPGQPTIDGDGNGDGIRDSVQANVGSLSVKTNSGASIYTTLVAGSQEGKADSDAATTRITNLEQKAAPADLPKGMETPLGLLDFSATLGTGRSTESFSLYVDPNQGINGYWVKDSAGTWVNLASEPYGGKMVTEGGRLRLDFKITDGGQYDADGSANGQISVHEGATAKLPLSIVGLAPDAAHPGLWF